MKIFEILSNTILLEYDRDVTLRQFGPALLKSKVLADYFPAMPGEPSDYHIKIILSYIEESDPTYSSETQKGGIYIPWITREVAKNNIKRAEDLFSRVSETLSSYHKHKNKRDFKQKYPQAKDIMKISWQELEQIIAEYTYTSDESAKGKYTKLFDDGDVTVIIPHDLAASKFWAKCDGSEAIWCTRFPNQFEKYTREGTLYEVIPKKPTEQGEKYLLHFESDQFMDENDEEISLVWLLKTRFPSLEGVFKKHAADRLSGLIPFAKPELIEGIFRAVMKAIYPKANSVSNSKELMRNFDDEGYKSYEYAMSTLKKMSDLKYADIMEYYPRQNYTEKYVADPWDDIVAVMIEDFADVCITRVIQRKLSNNFLSLILVDAISDDVVIRSTEHRAKPNPNRPYEVIDVVDGYEVGVMGPLKRYRE